MKRELEEKRYDDALEVEKDLAKEQNMKLDYDYFWDETYEYRKAVRDAVNKIEALYREYGHDFDLSEFL